MGLTQVSTSGIKDATVATADIADDAVTFEKIENITANQVLGRVASGTGEIQALSGAHVRGIINVADGATNSPTTTINSNADNRGITGSGTANTLNGESNVQINSSGIMTIGNDPSGAATLGGDLNVANTNGGTIVVGDTGSGEYLKLYASGTGAYVGSKSNHPLMFFTNDTGNERMRIDTSGKVGIGTSSPTRNLDVVGTLGIKNSSGAQWYVDRNDSNGRFELHQSNGSVNDGRKLNLTTDGQLEVGEVETEAGRGRVAIKGKNDDGGTPINLYLQEASGGEGYGIGVDADGDLNFYNSGATTPTLEVRDDNHVKITDGNLVIGTAGKGIDFSATGNASSSESTTSMSNELFDDYEVGTWQPTWTPASGSIGHLSRHGDYIKIGRTVHCMFAISSNGSTSPTGELKLTGLPFTATIPNANGTRGGGGVLFPGYHMASGVTKCVANGTTLFLLLSDSSRLQTDSSGIGYGYNAAQLSGMFSYITAS